MVHGSACRRDREKGTLEISHSVHPKRCRKFRNHKTSPIPASSPLDLRHVSDEDPEVDASFREIVRNLMCIAKQTGPDIYTAVRAIARFSHDPKEVHMKAARKVIE